MIRDLADPEQIPLTIPEPGAIFADALARILALDRGDAVLGGEAR